MNFVVEAWCGTVSNMKQPTIVQGFCHRHSYGSFLDTPDGLVCVECMKKAGELPEDYEACGECGFDHAYEPHEASVYHDAIRA